MSCPPLQNLHTNKRSWDDRFEDKGEDRDHAKVYVGSFKHAMFLTKYTGLGTLGADDLEFRSNDWYYLPNFDNELIDGLTLPGMMNRDC